ncbi:MAG: 4Fe-4S binding protein [Planctomycetes bacterium]|nr:4Fe-4S binding protein [Planctomycetota bacterium]
MKRQIIHINEDKCTGCGECIPNCPEGALQIIDGKARLMSDLFCDGLGACIGHCPEGAISTEEREAEPYDERKVMANIVKAGENTIKAHLKHLKEHNQDELLKQALGYLKENKISVPVWEEHKEERLPCVPMYRLGGNAGRSASEHRSGYPGTAMRSFSAKLKAGKEAKSAKVESQLTQWPVQLHLVPPNAPFLKGRDLVIAADCTAYAYGPAPLHFGGSRLNGSPLPKVGGNFHAHFLRDKALVIACPKLDNTEPYLEKLTEMFKVSGVKSITVLHMEVPCCSGLVYLAQKALEASGRKIPAKEITIGIQGDILGESKTN